MARGPIKKTEALMVARLRLLGATQVEAAKAAGVCERSVAGWEAAEWWPEFQEQARTSVHDQVEAFALRTVLEAARDGDAGTARWVLERLRPKTWGTMPRSRESRPVAGAAAVTPVLARMESGAGVGSGAEPHQLGEQQRGSRLVQRLVAVAALG